ncbi:MAG: helix-hairpin-helix domain-containing protein [Lachnospiraceae bacterium]|nr:helix-hairpin-helix domain-containing protein [Lachnospiraceae bacterium]
MNRAWNRVWKLAGMVAGVALLFLLAACEKQGTQIHLQEYTEIPEAELSSEMEIDSEAELSSEAATAQNTQEAPEAQEPEICVFVCGHVKEPGVYELPYGGRVCDGIALAGGLTEDADGTAVNQARPLVDGEKVYIPALGEDYHEDQSVIPYKTGTAYTTGSIGNTEELDSANGNRSLVNINYASKEELMTLPGIGETKAEAILTYRENHGLFRTKEDIMNIEGIKDGVYHKIEALITVGD